MSPLREIKYLAYTYEKHPWIFSAKHITFTCLVLEGLCTNQSFCKASRPHMPHAWGIVYNMVFITKNLVVSYLMFKRLCTSPKFWARSKLEHKRARFDFKESQWHDRVRSNKNESSQTCRLKSNVSYCSVISFNTWIKLLRHINNHKYWFQTKNQRTSGISWIRTHASASDVMCSYQLSWLNKM